MRYFKLFDHHAPEGDRYRVSDVDVVEYFHPEKGWRVGGWLGLWEIQEYTRSAGGRIEFVEE